MKTLLTIAALALALSAQGQILIYKAKISATQTGSGKVTKYAIGGYVVFDKDKEGFQFAEIIMDAATKRFKVQEWDSGWYVTVTGTGNKAQLVVAQVRTETDDGDPMVDSTTYKGNCTLADVGTGERISVPLTLQLTGRTVYPTTETSNASYVESTGTLTLDSTLTKSGNLADQDYDDAIDRIRTMLTAQGYAEME